MLLFRLNQLPDLFDLSSGFDPTDDGAIDEAKLGDDGRFTPVIGRSVVDSRGKLNDVRELLNDERRLLRLISRLIPVGRLSIFGEDDVSGVCGVVKLSARSRFDGASGV